MCVFQMSLVLVTDDLILIIEEPRIVSLSLCDSEANLGHCLSWQWIPICYVGNDGGSLVGC